MDHFKILRRAFSITVDYRALWVFGILLALTTASAPSSPDGGDGGNGYNVPSTGGWPEVSTQVISALIIAGVVLLLVALALAIVGAVVRYVSETALIRMVDQHEGAGGKVGVRQGFRLGWSRPALRIFLVDLLIGVSAIVVFLLLLLISATPLLVWLTDSVPARVLGTVLTAGLAMLVIFAAIAVSIVLSLLLQFFRRAVVLENLGVMEGMRRGLQLVRQRLGDVIVMGLILFGLGLAWVIVMIPLVLVLLIAAVVLGGLPALLVGVIVSLFAEGPLPWIVAAIVGAPIFFLVIGAPLLFLNGLAETFQSSAWTLTYRELLALEGARPTATDGNDSQPEPPA